MFRPIHVPIFALLLTGCALTTDPEPPTIPTSEPGELAVYTPPYCPLDRIEVRLPPPLEAVLPMAKPRSTAAKKPPRAQTPVQLVSQAQQAARVEPSERGYHDGSAEMVYAWAPGKVYTVYVTKKHATGIFLPPGERLVNSLYLDKDAFEVKAERAGSDAGAYDSIRIRPIIDSGETNAFILTESERRYLLHFVVGNTGMLAVTFEGPPMARQRQEEAAPVLILPRPPQ